MDRLRLIQGVILARRGRDLWVGNAGVADVRDLQIGAPAALSTEGASGGRTHR